MELLKIQKDRRGNGINSQGLFNAHQLKVAQTFGISIAEMIKQDMIMYLPNGEGEIRLKTKDGLKQAFKIEAMPEAIKQTLLTSSGTQPFMLNEAAAAYFGGSTGVFAPSVYGSILEGASMKATIPKLWGMQPFKENELSGDLIYFAKPNPWGDGSPVTSNTPVFERKAEGRAGNDLEFEVKREHFDAQRYICHLPYSYELQKILAGRLGLDQKVMEAFTEAAIYRDEYWAYLKWYLALTAGTLEGSAFAIYRDAVIADVDGIPACYQAYYNLTNGAIKMGDSTAYGSATSHTASGADFFDLLLYVLETMNGASRASTARGFRLQWNPEYAVIPQTAANQLIRDYKDGTLTTVWVAKQDIPMYKDEDNFLCRLNLGNKGVDVWVLPDEILTRLALANASTFVTTDSPTHAIAPMFFGRYMGMAASAPASPLLFFMDEGYEAVTNSGVVTVRRNGTKVHTMYQLKSEIPLNMSMSFVVKVIAT